MKHITPEQKMTAQFLLGCTVVLAGLVLLYIGCYIAPQGQIHESILVGVGEAFTFAGALIGVDYHYRYKNKDNGDNK